jgi:oxygen-independent coproporphyrinogen-3 oxidase
MVTGIGLYVHVPFCWSKCYYCDFFSEPYSTKAVQQYLQALEREARLYITSWLDGREVGSIYIGGGTPTALAVEELERLCGIIAIFPRRADAEWSVEANPDTLTREKLSILHQFGVNRLSLGVQSFDDNLLQFLGRTHSGAKAKAAWQQGRQAGFDNMSLDLIYGIPGQSKNLWQETLSEAVALAPNHISAYGLTIEEGTLFALRQLSPCPEELEIAQYYVAQDILTKAGLLQYEISNFARQGFVCRHNILYWQNESYLGLGPAAVSYLQKERWTNARDLTRYIQCLERGWLPIEERERVTAELEQAETVMLALRLKRGLSRWRFRTRFGQDIVEAYPTVIKRLSKYGLIEIDERRLRLSPRGLLLANQVAMSFLPDDPS